MKHTLFIIAFLLVVQLISAQNYFRSGIFLHHSTGNYIWGPNPDGNSTTTIPSQMHLYNIANDLISVDSVSLNEEWWSPSDNEWSTQHEFFEGNTAYTDITDYLNNNKIIVIKSCYPSSSIQSIGEASDTLNPTNKTIYNYKWHWRHIIKVMKNNPSNFFAIWTNAPLETASTNTQEAALSKAFCKWAKDTLAQGLDPIVGAFPENIYVFDFFSKITGSNGIMLNQYRTSAGDSHPNGAATDLVAPQFVQEIFNAARNYEDFLNSISFLDNENEINIYPNPINEVVNIKIADKYAVVIFYDILGNPIFQQNLNTQKTAINLSKFANGVYFLTIKSEKGLFTTKIIKNASY